MKPSRKLGILVVDDHSMTRSGIKALIEGEPGMRVVAESSTGEGAQLLYRMYGPHITLMDLLMPGMDGMEAGRMILSEFPDARIILISMSPDPIDVERARQLGMHGFLDKVFLRTTLIGSLRRVHAGGRVFGG